MDFKIAIDTYGLEKELQTNLTDKMRNAFKNNADSFFKETQTSFYDKENYKYVTIKTKGDGLKQIDEMIANKFLDPKFQETMQKFFDHNWERIFEECMTRALQHKANGIAFNKMHDFPPMKEMK